ncbi:MAG: hypothetical protein C0399_10065 [Syntrophus sp. (in: bacteria)]|nr:hypothetical protein [Syntrophus sp. (in: bacteria)]
MAFDQTVRQNEDGVKESVVEGAKEREFFWLLPVASAVGGGIALAIYFVFFLFFIFDCIILLKYWEFY